MNNKPSNKYIKKRDKHEADFASGKPGNSSLENRISIHINDENVQKRDYEHVIKELCAQFGKIKTIHVPGNSKKGNLVFVEYVSESDAEKAIKFINGDRALHMVANKARPPKRPGESNGSTFAARNMPLGNSENRFPRPPPPQQSNNFHQEPPKPRFIPSQNIPEKRDEAQSWRRPRDSEENRPTNISRPPRLPMSPPKMPEWRPEPPNNANVGKCNRCQRRAELKCQRCGDFYCSHVCQKTDWPSHKRHCFPMPDLVPAEIPLKQVQVDISASNGNNSHFSPPKPEKIDVRAPTFKLPCHKKPSMPTIVKPQLDRMIIFCDDDPKSGDIVAITWPCSTNRVYLIQNEGKMGIEYRETLTWASRPENHGPSFEESPEKGSLVFAEFENDWYRAVVQKVIDSEHVLVAFFDFGNTEQLHCSQLRHYLHEEDPVRYTYNVYLKDCPYDSANAFPENVKEYLQNLADHFTPLRIRYNGEWNRATNVELFVAETDVCVNDKICALLGTSRAEFRKFREENNKKMDKERNPVENIYFDDLQCERMETEIKTRVMVLYCEDLESNNIWCCLETANTSLKEIDSAVNEFASCESNLVKFLPKKDELCLVKRNESHFERAVLVEIVEEKARVLSIDYGGFYFVAKEDIYKFNKTLAMPLYTHMCQIQGFPSVIEGDLLAFLREELEGASFVVEKITFNEDEEAHILHMPKLVSEAVALGYLALMEEVD